MAKALHKDLVKGLLHQKALPVDDVPAMLTQNEFVIPADIVRIAGHGDPQAGAKYFQNIVDTLRKQGKLRIKKGNK